MVHNVIITDSDFADAEVEEKVLNKMGAKVTKYQINLTGNETANENKTIEITQDADGILVNYAPMSRRVISNLKRTKVIVRYGMGYDNIDVKAATDHNIIVCNLLDFMTFEVAHHTITLMLALNRKLILYDSLVKSGGWKDDFAWQEYLPLSRFDDKTVGIIGLGNIGHQVAHILKAFQVEILGYDPYLSSNKIKTTGARPESFENILRKSDIITLHCPLREGTKHLIGKKELGLMKESAMIVNTSRGGVIDQKALYEALKRKKLLQQGSMSLRRNLLTQTIRF